MRPRAKDLIGKLLVLDPTARLTAAAALRHPWIDAPLPDATLTAAQDNMRRMLRKRKFKVRRAVMGVTRSCCSEGAQLTEISCCQTLDQSAANMGCICCTPRKVEAEAVSSFRYRRGFNLGIVHSSIWPHAEPCTNLLPRTSAASSFFAEAEPEPSPV